MVRRVPVADDVIEYVMRLVRATRVHEGDVPEFVKEYVSWGAGPRACQFLILGAKVRAVLYGRYHVAIEDIQAIAAPVLRHRIVTNFSSDAEGFTSDKIVAKLIETIPATAPAMAQSASTAKFLK